MWNSLLLELVAWRMDTWSFSPACPSCFYMGRAHQNVERRRKGRAIALSKIKSKRGGPPQGSFHDSSVPARGLHTHWWGTQEWIERKSNKDWVLLGESMHIFDAQWLPCYYSPCSVAKLMKTRGWLRGVCIYLYNTFGTGGSVPFHKSLHHVGVVSGKYKWDAYCLRSGASEIKHLTAGSVCFRCRILGNGPNLSEPQFLHM